MARRILIFVVFAVLAANLASAGLRDIHPEKLPADPAVQKAYSDLLAIEELVSAWTPQWRHEIPKKKVVATIEASLKQFQRASAIEPSNQELLLLLGLTAHYGYNVDIKNSFEVAIESLRKAHTNAPEDYRAEWFTAIHHCQTLKSEDGARQFLQLEKELQEQSLPIGFWDDYLYCAVQTDMPVHALRAAAKIAKLNPAPSQYRDALTKIARIRLKTPDSSATYTAGQVWSTKSVNDRVIFANSLCGFSFSVHPDWPIQVPDIRQETCTAIAETGPHKAPSGNIIPNILVLARPQMPGESLDAFLDTFLKSISQYPDVRRTRVPVCPAGDCIAIEAIKPGGYKEAGDAHGIVIGFRRDQPEFPGLLLEEPNVPPASGQSNKVQYYRPAERLSRSSGTIYYLVLLDTAESVKDKALIDLSEFLASMRVE